MISILDKRESELIEKFPLLYKTQLAAGFDVPANEDMLVPAGEHRLIKTGLYIDTESVSGLELGPLMLFAYIAITPRSGMAYKKGLTVLNSPATIDGDYEGDIGVILHNTSKTDYKVSVGDYIAQAIVQITTRPFDMIPSENVRGEGGFGSTGK